MCFLKEKKNQKHDQKQVIFLQKGERLEALILLGIPPGTACYPV